MPKPLAFFNQMIQHPIFCALLVALLLSNHYTLPEAATVLKPDLSNQQHAQVLAQREQPNLSDLSHSQSDTSSKRPWRIIHLANILPKMRITQRSLLPNSQAGTQIETLEGRRLSLPEMVDDLLNSALFSMDSFAGGALSNLAGPNIEYGQSDDGTKLIARLRLPEPPGGEKASRKLHVAVDGKTHLRVGIETQSDVLTTKSSHTVSLPAAVQKEPIEINSNPDGSVRIGLTLLKGDDGASLTYSTSEESDLSSIFHRPMMIPFPGDAVGSSENDSDEAREFVRDLPSAADMDKCRRQFPNENLRVKHCSCGVTPSSESQAMCYGSLISKLVSLARRIELSDEATIAKHTAIDCLKDGAKQVACLERVSADILASIYHRKVPRGSSDISARIRNAIEADDDGPSELKPSLVFVIAKMCIMGFFAVVILSLCLVCAYRYRGPASRSDVLADLSSVLTQVSTSAEASLSGSKVATGPKAASGGSNRGPRNLSNKISQSHSSKLA